jgi:hypothetical protein
MEEYANLKRANKLADVQATSALIKKHLLAYAPKFLDGDNKGKFATVYQIVISLANTGPTSQRNTKKKNGRKSKRVQKVRTKQETLQGGVASYLDKIELIADTKHCSSSSSSSTLSPTKSTASSSSSLGNTLR